MPSGPFDFLLVDGGGEGNDQGYLLAQNKLYVSDLAPRATIYVENKRDKQRAMFEEALSRAHAHFRPWSDKAGYHIYQLDPTPAERVRIGARNAMDTVWHGFGLGKRTARACGECADDSSNVCSEVGS